MSRSLGPFLGCLPLVFLFQPGGVRKRICLEDGDELTSFLFSGSAGPALPSNQPQGWEFYISLSWTSDSAALAIFTDSGLESKPM